VIEQAEWDLQRCVDRAQLGRRFAEHHRLPEAGTRVTVAAAMGISEARLDLALGRDAELVRLDRHRGVYERLRSLGVSSMADLRNQLWGFESRLRAEASDDGSEGESSGGR
jgi:hypothetical protein